MIENEFRRPVSVDTAPRGSLCEWCGKPAEVQLTAIGGIAHNESGLFCNSCGQEFTRAVTSEGILNRQGAQGTLCPFCLTPAYPGLCVTCHVLVDIELFCLLY